MSEYIMKSEGPGSIAALVPGAALQHAPTIGANAPIRNVKGMTHGAYPVPSLAGGCSGCMGTAEEGGSSKIGLLLVPFAVLGGLWYLTRKPNTGMTMNPRKYQRRTSPRKITKAECQERGWVWVRSHGRRGGTMVPGYCSPPRTGRRMPR